MHKGIMVISHDFKLLKAVSDKMIYLHSNGSAEILSHADFFESDLFSQMQHNQKNIDFFS